MKKDGSSLSDHDIHRYLRKKGFANPEGEWFKCAINDLYIAILKKTNTGKTHQVRYPYSCVYVSD
ncbi:MAG: hypothetical protein WCR58_01435 [Bacteroidales bacterium]|nr:hypothetical protein [Bacteroidales bacterium]MDD3700414.1 hypothetical protein [Bacteroidales bacterium]MDY0368700.1 hypothetical protein [Bacteroidales bacterium]